MMPRYYVIATDRPTIPHGYVAIPYRNPLKKYRGPRLRTANKARRHKELKEQLKKMMREMRQAHEVAGKMNWCLSSGFTCAGAIDLTTQATWERAREGAAAAIKRMFEGWQHA